MKWINGYLMFDGQCKEAMEFYKACFGGELGMTNFTDEQAPGATDRVMHARLAQGGGFADGFGWASGRSAEGGEQCVAGDRVRWV